MMTCLTCNILAFIVLFLIAIVAITFNIIFMRMDKQLRMIRLLNPKWKYNEDR
jgi:hypothetical protein